MIDKFIGDYAFLNNFWPHSIHYLSDTWPDNEHPFQAMKTIRSGATVVVASHLVNLAA